MNEVFDINKMPDRRLHVKKMVALQQHMNISEAIRIIKREMSMQIAELILENKDLFWERSVSGVGPATIEYGADVVVLTREELAAIQHESFKKGAKHAQGFMQSWGEK